MADWSGAHRELEQRLVRAMAMDHGYPHRMPRVGRESAVLALFGISAADPEVPRLLLTERGRDLPHHRSQVAFPGGMRDADDEAAEHTALRETEEEVGVPRSSVLILGRLPVLNTMVTGFLVTPVVGLLQVPIEDVPLAPNPVEIARAEWVSWSSLLDPANYRQEPIVGRLWKTDVFQVSGLRAWGATAAMVRNLVERWRRAGVDGPANAG